MAKRTNELFHKNFANKISQNNFHKKIEFPKLEQILDLPSIQRGFPEPAPSPPPAAIRSAFRKLKRFNFESWDTLP